MLYRVNAKLVGNIPINLSTPTGALIGEESIEITSPEAIPLATGQQFYMIQDDLIILVEVAEDIDLVDGVNVVKIQPLLANIPPLSTTADRIGKHGNPIHQTVKSIFYAKLNTLSTRATSDMPSSGGTDSREVRVRGRLYKPKFMPPYFQDVRFYMLWQTGKNVCREGEFIADPVSASALRAEMFFGDRLEGIFITQNPASIIEGVVYEACC